MKKFIADEEQTGGALRSRDETSMFSLLLTLASSGCFDETGRIRGMDGRWIEGSNVSKLVAHVSRPEKLLVGTSEFAGILRSLGVSGLPNENFNSLMGIPPPSRSPSPLRTPDRRSDSPQPGPSRPRPAALLVEPPAAPATPRPEDVPLPESPLAESPPSGRKRKRHDDDSATNKRQKIVSNWQMRPRR